MRLTFFINWGWGSIAFHARFPRPKFRFLASRELRVVSITSVLRLPRNPVPSALYSGAGRSLPRLEDRGYNERCPDYGLLFRRKEISGGRYRPFRSHYRPNRRYARSISNVWRALISRFSIFEYLPSPERLPLIRRPEATFIFAPRDWAVASFPYIRRLVDSWP